jgi:hypothetical protein
MYFANNRRAGGSSQLFSRSGTRNIAGWTAVLCVVAPGCARAAEVTEAMWREVMAANARLQATVEAQQQEIAELRSRVDQLDHASTRQESTVADLRDRVDHAAPIEASGRAPDGRRLLFSGDAAVAFFAGAADSQFPDDEFRVDETTLRVEAEAARGIYLAGELQLTTRETRDEAFHLGEWYLEFENLGGVTTPDRLFNLRVGRVDIPFGEEYQRRGPLEDALITHSLSDIWGTDEGVELFGASGRASYAVAVQNGNTSRLRDFTSDKSVTARIGFDPGPRLHLSASAMRTGKLDAMNDGFSEIWFGNVVFRPIGSTGTTSFHADLAEFDATWSWEGGRLEGAVGRARYDDDDPLADNRRRFTYFQVEAFQHLTSRLYGAARYSRIHVGGGYPLAGLGNLSEYFFGPWTTDLWRLSIGGGYRFNPAVLFKLEYAWEQGDLRNGNARDNTGLFAAEAVVGF